MNKKKITVSLPEDLIEWVKYVAIADGISNNDVLIRSIKCDRFINSQMRIGNRIFVEDDKGNKSMIVRL